MSPNFAISDVVPLSNHSILTPPPTHSKITRTIPRLGFGVYQSPPSQTYRSCLLALKAGYRHIDSAQFYANEAEVGRAVRDSDALSEPDPDPDTDVDSHLVACDEEDEAARRRSKVFLTTKILGAAGSVDKTYEKCVASVERMDPRPAGYVDLFLIHSPHCGEAKRKELWSALERLYEAGRARSIGVSNFGVGHIEQMREYAQVVWPPQVNQIELHPFCQQRTIVQYCHSNNITLEAYSPLIRTYKSHDQTLVQISQNHSGGNDNGGNGATKSVAQILIRYCLQKGWIPLPKSDDAGRIAENADVFDFQLAEDEMRRMDGLDPGDGSGAVVEAVCND